MTQQGKPQGRADFRLQGTDGIRREVKPASSPEFRGLTPQQVFLERGIISEAFMELYAYAHVSDLMKTKRMRAGEGFVVGWDPRDIAGTFTGAVVRGVRKANAAALVLGVVPTPLVPIYMMYKSAGGGTMVTASHNPKDQNGIKTFCAFRGMKLLPDNDIELTRTVLALDYKRVKKLPLKGKRVDCRREGLELFRKFSLHPDNTWSEPRPGHPISFKEITLVVDPANGALSGIAAEAFRLAGFGQVVEVNARLNGDVNLWSGVADLEGHALITPEMTAKGSGHFHRHKAILKLFALGRKYKTQIREGRRRVCGAVFDADGDRFYRLDYDPIRDALLVLSGDETAFLQARYLIARDPERYRRSLYINTVESDLNAAVAAKAMGLNPLLTAVGDKWILLRVAAMIAGARLQAMKKTVPAGKWNSLNKKLGPIRKNGTLNVSRFQEIEEALDALDEKGPHRRTGSKNLPRLLFAVGSEETGHNITLGWLDCPGGRREPVFFGNGLKSALNTFAATQFLFRNKSVRTYYSGIHNPFPPGFKETLYVYYIRKELFRRNSAVWKRVKGTILEEGKRMGYLGKTVNFPEDRDMLYLSLNSGTAGGSTAAVFVRNSGTENKISVNLRGGRKDSRSLKRIGEMAIRILLSALKDPENHYYKLELDVLSQVAGHPVPEDQLALDARSRTRLLTEMGKQNLIRLTPGGHGLTPRGKWYITSDLDANSGGLAKRPRRPSRKRSP